MESRHAYRSSLFFLPIGEISVLESDAFFLMELQGATYDSAMMIPYSRRRRYVDQKRELEQKRVDQHNQQVNRARAQSRRRR